MIKWKVFVQNTFIHMQPSCLYESCPHAQSMQVIPFCLFDYFYLSLFGLFFIAASLDYFLSRPLWVTFHCGLSGLLFIAASLGYFLSRPLWITLVSSFNKPPSCKSHASPLSCRGNLTSASETSFLVLAPACDWLWIAWTRWERLSKVWEAGGEDSLREETRTRRCWGLARGRRRWRRTESQQSFTLFNSLCLSCSSSISFFSSFCSSAWRVCGAVKIQNVCLCVFTNEQQPRVF